MKRLELYHSKVHFAIRYHFHFRQYLYHLSQSSFNKPLTSFFVLLSQEKFDGATEVAQRRVSSRRQLVPVNPNYKPHTNADLVYLQGSPDFCERNLAVSIITSNQRMICCFCFCSFVTVVIHTCTV